VDAQAIQSLMDTIGITKEQAMQVLQMQQKTVSPTSGATATGGAKGIVFTGGCVFTMTALECSFKQTPRASTKLTTEDGTVYEVVSNVGAGTQFTFFLEFCLHLNV
jgi:hypothetical protein